MPLAKPKEANPPCSLELNNLIDISILNSISSELCVLQPLAKICNTSLQNVIVFAVRLGVDTMKKEMDAIVENSEYHDKEEELKKCFSRLAEKVDVKLFE